LLETVRDYSKQHSTLVVVAEDSAAAATHLGNSYYLEEH